MEVVMKKIDKEVKKIMREHNVSYKTGFLAESPLSYLPTSLNFEQDRYFKLINMISNRLTELIKNKGVAQAIESLWVPTFSFDNLERPVVNLLAYQLARIVHALFNEILPYHSVEELKKDESIKHLFPQLAIPLWRLSKIIGIQLDKKIIPYKNIKSFWISYEPEGIKELSIEQKKWYSPYIKIPLHSQNPVQIRDFMLNYAIEKEHEDTIFDTIARKLGI